MKDKTYHTNSAAVDFVVSSAKQPSPFYKPVGQLPYIMIVLSGCFSLIWYSGIPLSEKNSDFSKWNLICSTPTSYAFYANDKSIQKSCYSCMELF